MARVRIGAETVGEAILEVLADRGIDCVFGNASTSIIDGFAKFALQGRGKPRPVMVAHEQAAVAMGHGYYAVTGRMQAAIVYSTVGTANALGAIINASRARVPLIVLAARSALAEDGSGPGVRDIHVQWAQESFDQGAMVREWVKWDYELRDSTQVESAIDRAIEVALEQPRGPVYLSLPRDVLAQPLAGVEIDSPSRRIPAARRFPDPEAIESAAGILAAARNPLIITSEIGRDRASAAALVELCDAGAIGVLEASPVYANFPADHPCHTGYVFGSQVDPGIAEADAIMVLDCDVPWFPARVKLSPHTRVIHLGVEPFYQRYPMRNFRCDLAIVADPAVALPMLAQGVRARRDATGSASRLEARRRTHSLQRSAWAKAAAEEKDRSPIGFQWASRCIADVLDKDVIVVNEYPLDLRHSPAPAPGCYLGPAHSGGLGWGFGAALGAKMGAPDRTVVATLGDGSYIFSVPTACHQAARSHDLPILTIVFNNARWDEVIKSTLNVHPKGWAASTNSAPMTSLEPAADFEQIVAAFGGYGVRVEHAADLPGALTCALAVVRDERRQALVNIVCRR